MSFWNIAGKIGKGALDVAVHVTKELPAFITKNAADQLNSNHNLTDEKRERLERIVERGKNSANRSR